MSWLALDIGGANVKVADGKGYAQSYGFAMWKQSARLAQQIRTAIYEAPAADHLAVTMTGELADCFASKAVVLGNCQFQVQSFGSQRNHLNILTSVLNH